MGLGGNGTAPQPTTGLRQVFISRHGKVLHAEVNAARNIVTSRMSNFKFTKYSMCFSFLRSNGCQTSVFSDQSFTVVRSNFKQSIRKEVYIVSESNEALSMTVAP